MSDGKVRCFDWKTNKIAFEIEMYEKKEGVQVQTVIFVNKCLGAMIGYSDGSIHLYDLNQASKPVSVIENAHIQKDGEGVSCLIQVKQADDDQPFIVSCGADGNLKIFELNPYFIKNVDLEEEGLQKEESGKDDDQLKKEIALLCLPPSIKD